MSPKNLPAVLSVAMCVACAWPVFALQVRETVDPWDNYYAPAGRAPDAREVKTVSVHSARNEFPVAALELFNDATHTAIVRVRAVGPDDGSLVLREGVHVRVRLGQLVADALPVLSADGVLSIPAGENRQVWLEFNTRGQPAGTQSWRVEIEELNGKRATFGIPVDLKIDANIELPVRHPLSIMTWDGGLQGATGDLQRRLADELFSHYVNTFHVIAPIPATFDANGELVDGPHFGELDEAITPLIGQGQLLLRAAVPRLDLADGKRLDIRTDVGKRAYALWLTKLIAHLESLGLGYEDWVLYPYDERMHDHFYHTALAAKSVSPKVRVYANPIIRTKREEIDRAIDENLVDYFQPHAGMLTRGDNPEYLAKIRERYKGAISTYWCNVVQKRLHTIGFYRRMGWVAWSHDLDGVGNWTVYAVQGYREDKDWGGTPWDDFRARTANPTGVYPGRDLVVVPSRRWQAFRSGLEDYLYLQLLEQSHARRGDDAGARLVASAREIYGDGFYYPAINALRGQIVAYLNQQ